MSFAINRRVVLASAVTIFSGAASGSEPGSPKVTRPRATDGDQKSQPNWDEHLTISVGNRGADINGSDDRAIQSAVDYVRRMGAGTVKLTPGVFKLRNSIQLPSNLRLVGSGDDTVITKHASHTANIVDDSDWYDQEITLKSGHGFRVGDAVFIRGENDHNGDMEHLKRTLIARKGNRFKLNDGLRKNILLSGKPNATSIFPLLTSEYTADVVIEDMVLDGNRANNENMNGNY